MTEYPLIETNSLYRLSLHNWNDKPPTPWTMQMERRWPWWHWQVSMRDRVVSSGKRLNREKARREAMRLLKYAILV